MQVSDLFSLEDFHCNIPCMGGVFDKLHAKFAGCCGEGLPVGGDRRFAFANSSSHGLFDVVKNADVGIFWCVFVFAM